MKLFKFIRKPWVIIVLILLIAGGGYFTYRTIKSKQSTTTYKTTTVTKGTLTATVSGTGNIIVGTSASISPTISGEVYGLAVKIGDTVKKGQTLFKISNSDLDVDVSKAYASYIQAQQSLTDSQNALTAAQNSQTTINDDPNSTDDQKAEAAQKVTSATTAVTVAGINLQSAESSYNSSKKTAGERIVKATIDGTITSVNVTNGDSVGGSGGSSQSSSNSNSSSSSTGSSTSSSAAIVINDLGSLQASIMLNEVDAVQVKINQSVSMTFDAIDDLTLTGKITTLSVTGSESSGVVSYPATISFDLIDSRLKPSMSVTATITTEIKQDVLTVPNSAVKGSGTESYVLLMKDGSPIKTSVTIGIANDSYTEIVSGLSENDTVVTQTITNSSMSSSSTKSSSGSGMGSITGSSGMPPGGMGGPGM